MPKEMNLDPSAFMIIADALAEGHQGDPEAAQLVQALQDEDSEVQQIEAEHAAQLDRIIAAPIRADDPTFAQRASDRRAAVYAHQKTLPAVGADPYGGFVEPEGAETYTPDPKAASGYVVERKRRMAGAST